MGINGLHKALSFCTVKDNLKSYRNKTIAIDTSSWIYRSVYSISQKFVESTEIGKVDEQCVRVSARYIITRCKELIEGYEIQGLYLILDGQRCPLKADETQERESKRKQNLKEARRYKNLGDRIKSEDKYKSCIRIRREFTESVIAKVKEAFVNYRHGFVHVCLSPYEADSMLVKVVLDGKCDAVITEDSDVLVYSAAAHKAFPILFKLDRGTGDCDRISMDWLLSDSAPKSKTAVATKNNNLETILRRFATRQAVHKGFGVRLFVQSCILAGSDYSINTLDGIGLISAFKLVRDNAFRNDSVRFKKILQSLPKKIKGKINIDEYEERLAKSEAVFFYHPVQNFNGDITPLLTPRTSPPEDEEDKRANHFPSMSRFHDDWSFLGDISPPGSSSSNESTNKKPINESQLVQKDTSIGVHSFSQPKIRNKWYSKSKPLNERDGNAASNYTHKSATAAGKNQVKAQRNVKNMYSNNSEQKSTAAVKRQPKTRGKNDQPGPITKYLCKEDPRLPKFSSTSITRNKGGTKKNLKRSRALSSYQIGSFFGSARKKPRQSFSIENASKVLENKAGTDFVYDVDSPLEDSKHINATSISPSNKSMPRSSFCNLTQPSSSSSSPENLAEIEEERDSSHVDQTSSRFFFPEQKNLRRVTLDSQFALHDDDKKQSTCGTHKNITDRNSWESDEIIDDSDEEDLPTASAKFSQSHIKVSSRNQNQLKPLHPIFCKKFSNNKKQIQFTNKMKKRF